MLAAGARFAIISNPQRTSFMFSYAVPDGGDAAKCREIMDRTKARGSLFFAKFKVAAFAAICRGAIG